MKWKVGSPKPVAPRYKNLFVNRQSLKLDSPLEMFVHFIKVILSIEFIMIIASSKNAVGKWKFFSMLRLYSFPSQFCRSLLNSRIQINPFSHFLITLFLLLSCGVRDSGRKFAFNFSIAKPPESIWLFSFCLLPRCLRFPLSPCHRIKIVEILN